MSFAFVSPFWIPNVLRKLLSIKQLELLFVACFSMCTPGGLSHDLSLSPLSLREEPPHPSSLTRSARDPLLWLLRFSALPTGSTSHTCTAMFPPSTVRFLPVARLPSSRYTRRTKSEAPGPRCPPGPALCCRRPEASAPPLPRAAGLISAHRGLWGVAGTQRKRAAWARGPEARAARQAAGCSGCCGSCCCSAWPAAPAESRARMVSAGHRARGTLPRSGGSESGRGRIMEAERRGARQAAPWGRWGV